MLVKYVSIGMTAMFFLTLCVECISTKGYQHKPNAMVTTEKQFEMSQDENFIILVLDALDASTFNTMLEGHPEYKEIFSDFTYYPNTMGTYSFTSRSIPFILSGEWFENEKSFEEYRINAYKNSPLFTMLEERKYNLGIYEPDMPITYENIYRFENIAGYNATINSYINFIKYELKLTMFKYAPFGLKKYCVINPKAFEELRKIEEESDYSPTWFSGYNTQFYEDIYREDITCVNQKCFKFIHIEGAHVPFKYDKNVNVIENGTYEQNIEACITIANAYLEKLKESNMYDNSIIIIMADHGYEWEGGYAYGRQNPLLMIKGRNETHPMQISNAPISYDDLQLAYQRLLGGEKSDNVFDYQEGDQRERRFLMYIYLEENHMVEYMQTGEASDPDSMYPTGREFNQ